MNALESSLVQLCEQKTQLLESCLKLQQQKTDTLTSNDLSRLEGMLQEEAALWSALSGLDERIEHLNQELAVAQNCRVARGWKRLASLVSVGASSRLLELGETLGNLAREIQAVNKKNGALAENGRQFCNAVLEALLPQQTYHPAGKGTPLPSKTLFSAEC